MSVEGPNIIYILGDDHRVEQQGGKGDPILQTPNLDALARDGVQFTHAFCTSPACTPSRTSHYTGQWERRHGINFNSGSSLDPVVWEQSFPMQLKNEGYFLGWVGKNTFRSAVVSEGTIAGISKASSTTGTATTATAVFIPRSWPSEAARSTTMRAVIRRSKFSRRECSIFSIHSKHLSKVARGLCRGDLKGSRFVSV